MDDVQERCRCCFAATMLETLQSPDLDVYKIICNLQDVEIDEYHIKACFQCLNFLKDLHRFRIRCLAIDRMLRNNLPDPNTVEIELMPRKTSDDDLTHVKIKTEITAETDEIDIVDIKVEVDSMPENLDQGLEMPLEGSLNYFNDESENPPQVEEFTENVLECSECSFKCKRIDLMKAHRATHVVSANLKNRVHRPRSKRTLKLDNDVSRTIMECDTCSYKTTDREWMEFHQSAHAYHVAEPYNRAVNSSESTDLNKSRTLKYEKITNDKKIILIKCYNDGRTISESAKIVGINRNTARGIIHKYYKNGESAIMEERRGGRRHIKLTPEIVNEIAIVLEANPALTLRSIKEKIAEQKGVILSLTTINTAVKQLRNKIFT